MKKLLPLFAVTALVLANACSKDDNIGTKPQLTFKSYSIPYIDTSVQSFDVTFQVKDGDGDLENLFYFLPVFDSDPSTATDTNFQFRRMPDIGVHKGGKVDAELIYNMVGTDFRLVTSPIQPDSMRLRCFVVDEAGHSSDTILTPKLAYIKE